MATASRTRFRIDRPSVKDRQRWYLWKSDLTVEEIAAREHASIKEVQRSIDRVESYRFLGSVEEVDAEYNVAALELIQEQKEVVRRAMRAKTVRTNPVTGADKVVDDFATQLSAAKEAREMAGVTRAKGGPAIVNNLLQQNNGGAQRPGGGMDFESKLRELRAKHAAEMPVTITRQLGAPQPEKSHAERLAEDMEDSGIELDDDELAELEGEVEDGEEEAEFDEVSDDGEGEEDGEGSQEKQVVGGSGPAQDANPEEGW